MTRTNTNGRFYVFQVQFYAYSNLVNQVFSSELFCIEKNWLWKNTHNVNLPSWLFSSVQFSNVNYIVVQTISRTSYLAKWTLYSFETSHFYLFQASGSQHSFCLNDLTVLCCFLVVQSCLTLCKPKDFLSPSDSSVHGISQARLLEWVTIPFSRGSSWPRDRTCVFCIGRWVFYHWATWETLTILDTLRK